MSKIPLFSSCGIDAFYEYDDLAKKINITYSSDVETTIKRNKVLRQCKSRGWNKDKTMQYVGEIPLLIYHEWIREAGVSLTDRKACAEVVRKKLNDPFNAYMRTGGGRL